MTTPPTLTDETHIHIEGWGEMNDHPDIGLIAERIVANNLDGGRRRAEESAERLAGLLVAFGEHLISAERTRADTAEARAAYVVERLHTMQNSENMALVAAEAQVATLTAALELIAGHYGLLRRSLGT